MSARGRGGGGVASRHETATSLGVGASTYATNDRVETVVPASRRPDGSLRKEIRVRAGFVPQEEVARYKPPGARARSAFDSPVPPPAQRALPVAEAWDDEAAGAGPAAGESRACDFCGSTGHSYDTCKAVQLFGQAAKWRHNSRGESAENSVEARRSAAMELIALLQGIADGTAHDIASAMASVSLHGDTKPAKRTQ